MTTELTYRGRTITCEDIVNIKDLIAAHPGESRRTLSTKLCEAWQWRQANGALRDMVCRGMLLMLRHTMSRRAPLACRHCQASHNLVDRVRRLSPGCAAISPLI